MSEQVRAIPLTEEQKQSLEKLRSSCKFDTSVVAVNETTLQPKDKLVGQNTLRFVIQHMVQAETGLSHFFNFNYYVALDQRLMNQRLTGLLRA